MNVMWIIDSMFQAKFVSCYIFYLYILTIFVLQLLELSENLDVFELVHLVFSNNTRCFKLNTFQGRLKRQNGCQTSHELKSDTLSDTA